MAPLMSQKFLQPLKSSNALVARQGLSWMKRERNHAERKWKEEKKKKKCISFSTTWHTHKHFFRGWGVGVSAIAISNKIELANPAGRS